MNIIDFEITPYREMWERQKLAFAEAVECKRQHRPVEQEYIMVGEHPPVYTLGFHGNQNNLLASEEMLRARGAECIRIERGGDITYHGPGQLIAYPIIDLEKRSLGVKGYMHLLEESVIRLIAEYGIKGERVEGATGIWIDVGTPRERKICAMGVKCTRFVTMHGLALNVNTDMTAFAAINPCGFIDKGVTSMALELNHELDMSEVKARFVEILSALLTCP